MMEIPNPKLYLRGILGKNPLLFYPVYSLKRKNIESFTKANTQIVIEGFPRSGNTFAVEVFRYLQQSSGQIASHHHVPAQIIKAAELNIPTIVLIRNPTDAIVSYKIYDPSLTINQALRLYIGFYRAILPYRSHYVMVNFKEITTNFSRAIERVNLKFNTSFVSRNMSSQEIQAIIKRLETGDPFTTHVPNQIREKRKQVLKAHLESGKYESLLQEADSVYHQINSCTFALEYQTDKVQYLSDTQLASKA